MAYFPPKLERPARRTDSLADGYTKYCVVTLVVMRYAVTTVRVSN